MKATLIKSMNSFRFAINGFRYLLLEEHNGKIHVAVAVMTIILSIVLSLNVMEWLAISFCIGIVLSMELFNSSIEALSDFSSPEWNLQIKKTKDLSAAAVLVAALTSAVVGCLIFIPKIIDLCTSH